MKIFLTNIPAFYKINMYNELAKRMPILVVFAGIGSGERNADFVRGNMQFEYVTLKGSTFSRIWQLFKILRKNTYDEFIVGGWENIISLTAPFLSRKALNACIIESSAFESQVGGG